MSYREEANPARALFLQEFALVGNVVTQSMPQGTLVGTITRKTDASIWVRFEGYTYDVRFTQRINGEYRQHGKGKYRAALEFDGAKEESWRRVSAAAAERKALADLIVEMRKELRDDRTLHMASRTVARNSENYLVCLVIPETGGTYVLVHYVTSEDEYEVPFRYATGTVDAEYTVQDLGGAPEGPAYLVQRAIDGYKGPWYGA